MYRNIGRQLCCSWALVVIFCVTLFSCSDFDSVTTSPSARLTFSVDTVAFDTIISTTNSSTKTLIVFNRNADGLRITNVRLGQGASSPFRVNVDGQSLYQGQGEDFLIRRRDSLVVRLEVTPPAVGSTEIGNWSDCLRFRLESGVEQEVQLTAGSIDAHIVHGMLIDRDSTLSADMPYVIYDSLTILPDVTLTLLPGTRLMFHDKAFLDIYGRLEARGSMEKPVIFRGDRMDHMFDYLLYDNTPNRWEGIRIREGSQGNVFSFCDIHSGRYGILCDSTSLDVPTLFIENSVIHNLGGDGLRLDNCVATVANTQISNTLGRCIAAFGGVYEFLHCTVAQFYPFDANRQEALYIANVEGENYRELRLAHFRNCVITGYGEDVIMGSISEGQDYMCDYLFSHSFLNTVLSEDTVRFTHVIYDGQESDGSFSASESPSGNAEGSSSDAERLVREQNFVLFDTDNFIYDFTPDSLSSIRGLADTLALKAYPFDRLGRSRLADGAPDAGCYEYEYVKP